MKKLIILCCSIFIVAPLYGQVTAEDLPKAAVNTFWTNFEYFGGAAALTDAMKQASDWNTNADTLILDEYGYPTTLDDTTFATTYPILETTYYPTGDYTVMWEGDGNFMVRTCDGASEFENETTKTQTITVTTPCEEGISITIYETVEGDHLRNIRLYLPGYDANSNYWTDHFIDFHAQFSVLRFIWGSGLYSPQTSWEERSELSDRTWHDSDAFPMEDSGVPFEAMIQLANEAGVDLWITSPVRANHDFETRMATMIRDSLNDSLKVWVEWGNEYWNCGYWGYEGCVYLSELVAESGEDIDAPHMYAREALDLFSTFDSVFTATGQEDRMYTVLGGQSGWAWHLQQSMGEVERLGRLDDVDMLTIAPYYSEADIITPAYETGGLDAAFPLLDTVVVNIFDGQYETGQEFALNFDVARQYNKPMVAYEGGQHLTTSAGLPAGFAAEVSMDERMYEHTLRYLTLWEDVDVTSTFAYFTNIARYDENEAFALLDNYEQPLSEAPKLRAFLDWQAGVRFITASETEEDPIAFEVFQNYPNPFNPSTVISYQLPANSLVKVQVFDLAGREVATLVNDAQTAGAHQVTFDASGLASGVYLYRVHTNFGSHVSKMLLLK